MDEKQCVPTREKYWSELTDSEKIERMRQRVKYRDNMMDRCLDRIARLEHLFRMHSHTPTGEPVVPVSSSNQYDREEGGPCNQIIGNPAEVYF